MTVRLVISDIDGTLARTDKTVSDAVVAAAHRLRDADVPFTLISARPPSGIQWIADKLGLTAPYGAFNGGTIVSPDGTIVASHQIDADAAAGAIAMLDYPSVSLWLFARGEWHAADADNPHVPHERLSAHCEPMLFRDPATVAGPYDKIVGVCDDHDLLAELEKTVAGKLEGRATVARSQAYYLDITAPAANKGDGIVALAKTAGVPLEDVAVLGDQRNDLPMFARAGLSIAMGQAPDEVKAAATKVTVPNDADGVAHAIDEIILPLARSAADTQEEPR